MVVAAGHIEGGQASESLGMGGESALLGGEDPAGGEGARARIPALPTSALHQHGF